MFLMEIRKIQFAVNISLRLLTKIDLVFLVLVKFDGYFKNMAIFATEFIDLGVRATLFKDIYSVVYLFISCSS